VEKVDESVKEKCLETYFKAIDNKDIYRIPLSQQRKVRLNRILSKYVTKDLFSTDKKGKKRYELWKEYPVMAISHFDLVCEKKGFGNVERAGGTRSALIRMLLRMRGENKMEQLEEEKRKELEKVKHDNKLQKKDEVTLSKNFIQEIKDRSQALAEEDKFKRELINRAKNKGWLGVTVEEIDLDLSETYRKLSEQVRGVEQFDPDSLKLLQAMQSLKRDKMDIYKFQMNMQLKLAELEEKKNLRKKVSTFKMDEMKDKLVLE